MEHLHMNEIRELVYRFRQGQGVREIARALGFSRNTVRKYQAAAARHGLLAAEGELPDGAALEGLLGRPAAARPAGSTVEPFGAVVAELAAAGVEMMAIWQRLRQEHGYTGSYSSVRRYVGRLRPPGAEAVCRVETSPGEEAQVDFGWAGLQWDGSGGRRRRAWVFVMTLSWSRHQYVEFVFDQTILTWLSCHERAFAWFGGVPERLVIDNLKAAIIRPDLHDPVLGEPYRRLAQHYGFLISPNRPRTPRHKGKVESGVHYVKRNFLAGQTFADLEAMNERGRRWTLETAGQRRHGTTQEAPLGRFEQTERSALRPLPDQPFDLLRTYRAKVHRDCHVTVDDRYYSVPWRLIGQTVDVYVGRRVVEIYHGTRLAATHPVEPCPGGRQTRPEHYPESKRAFLDNPPQRCRERAEAVGPSCARVVQTLLEDRPTDHLRSVQALLRLAERVGKERLEAACRRALHYGDASYRRIKTILEAGLDGVPLEDSAPTPRPPAAAYRYARDGRTFFAGEGR
jgi:transposase